MRELEPKLKAKEVVTEISRERVKLLLKCTEVFEHRLLFQLPGQIDRVCTQLSLLAETEMVSTSAHEYINLMQLLEKEKSNISSDFSEVLRELVDQSFEGRRDDVIEAEHWSLVDESSIEHDIAVRGLEKSLSLKSNDAVNKLNEQLAKILSEDSIDPEQNPFNTQVICDALVKVLEKRVTHLNRRTIVIRLLARSHNLDVPAIYADLSRLLDEGGYKANKSNFKVNRKRDKNHDAPTQSFDTLLAEPALSQAFLQAILQRVQGVQGVHTNNNTVPPIAPNVFTSTQTSFPTSVLADTQDFPAIQFQNEVDHSFAQASVQPNQVNNAGETESNPVQLLSQLFSNQPALSNSANTAGQRQLSQASQPLLNNLYQTQNSQAKALRGEAQLESSLSPVSSSGMYQNIIRQTALQLPANEQPNVLDATIIELVAMLFDFMFSNKQLSDEIKAMLARLQLPMVRAAMIDRAFFSSRTHPARLMLNRLAEIGEHWSPHDGKADASYLLIDKTVNQLLSEFDQDLSVFSRLLINLESFTESERQEAAPALEKLLNTTGAEDAKKLQKADLARIMRERLESRPLPNFVLEFLSKHWIIYLDQTVENHGFDSDRTNNALATVDDLLTTMQSSVGGEERRGLIKALPQLIQKLKSGCDEINIDEAEKRLFFDQMFEFHARLLKGQATHLPEDSKGQSDYILDPEIDLSLDETDVFHDIVENIERGTWIEIEDDIGKLQLAKLSWISPKRTTFLFTTRSGRKAASFSPLDLANSFRSGLARILESEPMVDRAMAHILGQLVPNTTNNSAFAETV